jgi:hypothetical protein
MAFNSKSFNSMAFNGIVSVQPPLAGLCDSIVTDRGSQHYRDRDEKADPRSCGAHTDQARLPARDYLLDHIGDFGPP